MTAQAPQSVARFTTEAGGAVGGGCLLPGPLILTCAHVVNAALGRQLTSQERPKVEVRVTLPLLPEAPSLSGRVAGWVPLSSAKRGDLAVLALSAPLPADIGIAPLRLVDRRPSSEEPLRVYGFPLGHPAGVWKVHLYRAGPTPEGWEQVVGRGETEYKLQTGFSGCPVFDSAGDVLGILAATEEAPATDAAEIIPAATIVAELRALPNVPAPDLQAARGPSDQLALSALRVCDRGPGLSLLDLIVRNSGSAESIIHRVDFRVLRNEPVALGAHPYYFPSTHQYNMLITPSDRYISLDVEQLIPPRAADRFQVIIGLGTEQAGDNGGPWGSSGIGWINDPVTDTKLVYMRTQMQLTLVYNEGMALESEPFDCNVIAPGFGFKAATIAGLRLEDKLALLRDKDVNVVQSVVATLGSIGGPEVLQALRRLTSNDLDRLRRYYSTEIYDKIGNKFYWSLPSPDERLDDFKMQLERVIARLAAEETR